MKESATRLMLLLALLVVTVVIFLFSDVSKVGSSAPPSSAELLPLELNLAPRVYDQSQVEEGLNLIPVSGPERVYLSKLNGEIVHSWRIDAARARLLSGCRLLVIHGSKQGLRKRHWRVLKPFLRIYDRHGKVEWEYTAQKTIHHDVHQLQNEDLVFLQTELIDLSTEHRLHAGEGVSTKVRSDSIQIVGMDRKVRWQWMAHEHLDLENCDWNGCEKNTLKERGEFLEWDWTHINTVFPIPSNRHFDNGDSRFRPGNFLVIPRNFWTVYALDYPSGEVLWRYGGGQDREGALVRGHEAQMIEEGLPGEGNILLFDNGFERIREYSRILEIDPQSKQLVWSYEDRSSFFSVGGGSVQRLKNGNTLISEDVGGRVFEINRQGQIVWEVNVGARLSRARRYPLNSCRE